MPLPCAYCGELLADSHAGLRAHYERYHPETRPFDAEPETVREMENFKRKELIRRMEQKKGIWHFFGRE